MKKQKPQNKQRQWIAIVVLAIMATLILFALRPWHAWQNTNPDYYGINLFSYFTTQSNLIAAATYLIAVYALLRRKELGAWFSYLRGGATLYMTITGIVYTLLLHQYVEANDWQNSILHQFGPLFILGWWLIWPSRHTISAKGALWWLVFPVAWIIYTLTRAAHTGWYPYPFLNPDKVGGHGTVALYVLGISIGFVIVSQCMAWLSRLRAKNTTLY
jgi:hypothetical protein